MALTLTLVDRAAWIDAHGSENTALAVAQELLNTRGQDYRSRMDRSTDAALLEKVKAAPKELRDQINAVKLTGG